MAWESDDLIAASGGDYATIVLFEAAHDGDTPSSGTICQGRVKGNTESSTCYWSGWQSGMNSTTKIVLTAESGSETDGTDGSGDDAVVDQTQILFEQTNNLYIDITRIEFTNRVNVSADGGGEARFGKCFFRNIALGGVEIVNCTADYSIKVGVCLFKAAGTNTYRGGVFLNDADVTTPVEVINCTSYGSWAGFAEFGGTMAVKNCAAGGTTNNCYYGITTQSYNAADDTSAAGTGSVDNITPADEWTSPGTGSGADFTIKDTNADIYHAGITPVESWFSDLCGTTDLVGTTWNSSPSMGCFEYAAGAPSGNPWYYYAQQKAVI